VQPAGDRAGGGVKLVIGVHHYPPSFFGGVELLAERMARRLVAQGHAVEVVCVESVGANRQPSVRTDWQDGVLVHRLELPVDESEPLTVRFQDGWVESWFTEYLERTRPDVFHSLSSYVLTASAIEAAVRLGIPTVAGLDDYWYFCPRMSLLRSNGERCRDSASPTECAWCLMGDSRRYRLVDRAGDSVGVEAGKWLVDRGLAARIDARQQYLEAMLHKVDAIVTPAPLVHDLLLRRGHTAQRVRLVEHGLDTDTWQSVPRTPRTEAIRIGYLGQIIPAKGVHVLIEAFQRLGQMAPVQLDIYGDTTRFAAYAARLRRLAGGDPRIRFRGPYPHADVACVLANFDVLVFPSSWYEILGMVILEAFQAGLPVVASRLPNHGYHVRNEVDGLLFEADNAMDLSRQLRRLIDEPELLSRLASNVGPVRTLDAEMAELERVYTSLVLVDAAVYA
jgi:glycosyltransferase involved in cell wall biosynthesis